MRQEEIVVCTQLCTNNTVLQAWQNLRVRTQIRASLFYAILMASIMIILCSIHSYFQLSSIIYISYIFWSLTLILFHFSFSLSSSQSDIKTCMNAFFMHKNRSESRPFKKVVLTLNTFDSLRLCFFSASYLISYSIPPYHSLSLQFFMVTFLCDFHKWQSYLQT